MRLLETFAIVTAVLIGLAGCTQVGAPASESTQVSPDEFELTRKVVCEVPGEGRIVLIYSSCLHHNGRVIREPGPVSRPAFHK